MKVTYEAAPCSQFEKKENLLFELRYLFKIIIENMEFDLFYDFTQGSQRNEKIGFSHKRKSNRINKRGFSSEIEIFKLKAALVKFLETAA